MDTMELLKCEPEEAIIVKSEPIFTENSYDDPEGYDVTVNNDNLIKTECESVSFSSNCGCLNSDIIKQECKCSFCMRNQVATFLPTVKPAFKEESCLTESEHSQENTGNLMSTRNSASCIQTRQPKIQTKTRHFCPYCNRNFTRRDSLSIHLRRKHSEKHPDFPTQKCNKEFTCEICKFKSSCSRSLKSHMLTHETFVDTNNMFRCNNCDYETFKKSRIQLHIQRMHSNDRTTYACRLCGKTLFRNDSLGDHLLSIHGEKFEKTLKTLFSRTIKHCNLCDFRTIMKFKLVRHMNKHGYGQPCNKKRYSCTTKKSILTDHLFAQHDDKFDKSSNDRSTYSCRFCNKSFLKKVSLANHLLCCHGDKFDKTLKTILSRTIKHCKLCDFRITSKYLLDQHIRGKHSNDRPTYSCRFCNKTFLKKSSLADHLLLHHGENFEKSLNKFFSRTIKHCKLCDFRTITKLVLNQHMTKHGHSITNKRIYKCINCDYETIRKCHLRFHIQKKHSNAKPTYSCKFCSKTFFYKLSIAHHLLCQHDEKFDKSLKTLFSLTIKYCKLCDFRTIRKGTFQQHIAKHGDSLVNAGTDTLTYKCNNYDYETILKPELIKHMTKHGVNTGTETTIFKCNNCDYETVKKCNLQGHIQNTHSNNRPRYSCRFCNKTFFNKISLASHLMCKHGEKIDKSLETLLSQTIKHCKLCDFRCIGENKLNRHTQSKHYNDTQHSRQTV